MKRFLFPIWSYFKYWLRQEDQYSIQSPFVFEVYNGLIGYVQENQTHFIEIEDIREALIRDKEVLAIDDFGAGSKRVSGKQRRTNDIVRYSSSSRKHSLLYQFFCTQTPAHTVLELGTCLGVNSRYLAAATKGKMFTLEGSKKLWEKAQHPSKAPNCEYLLGEISQTLPELLKNLRHIDFALIDATHTFEATIQYFEAIMAKTGNKSILAIADIHWSAAMEKAWRQIKTHPRVQISIDFYECGILVLDPKLTKAHYVLKF